MIRFNCDYLEGCHPAILDKLMATNMEQHPGYGEDEHCAHAAQLIRETFCCEDAAVHFLVGGTQANTTVIAAALRPYEGVLCADTGHINTHETGAIESSGHKCLALPHVNGLITAQQVRDAVALQANDEHVVKPGMVYISMSTEMGTLYTKQQLQELYAACQECELPLFIDGARLGYALAAPACDVTPADLASLCDVFTVGGTKVGALFGDAVVIKHAGINRNFRYMIKQRGGMLAKGRLLGIQFEGLMEGGLYLELGRHAVELALRLRAAFEAKGFPLRYDSRTNQQFPILPDPLLDRLGEKYAYSFWEKVDEGHSAVRFCTSWCTREEDVDALIADIAAL